MSSSNLSANDEFDEQLRMQELYGDPKDGNPKEDPGAEAESLGQQPDDTPYEWDLDKKAWFPKITEDFIATYQANYGFSNDGASSSTANVQDGSAGSTVEPPQRKLPEPTEPKKKGEKRKAESGWFHVEEDRNTNVYVSGLPPDITVDEFIQLMSKFGIIMRDPQTEEFKVKLYKDNQGNLKGDGLCCYLKRESVDLALKLLDEDEIRGYKLHVEVAQFQLKGEYDASKKKKKCKDYKKKLSMQQKQLDWRPERKAGPSRMRHERVVILKNMFHPEDFEDDPLVLNEIRDDLRVECSKFGQIKRIILFDRHPDGVASVSFRDPEEADCCIQTLDGRWFGGRQITAEAWDGTTDYQVEETTREREERLRGWEAFLNAPEGSRGPRVSNQPGVPERAGPSRERHFSERAGTSQMNAPEATVSVASEAHVEEKKAEKPADRECEEEASGKGAYEGDSTEKCEEGCPNKESKPGCPAGDTAEGSPRKEPEDSGSKRERSKKKLKKDSEEESSLEKESKEDSPEKHSEDEGDSKKESEDNSESEETPPEKQCDEESGKACEANGLEKEADEDDSEKELENILRKEMEDFEKSEFEDDGSEKESEEEEGSERESEDSDEKEEEEEDTDDKVFDEESDENEDGRSGKELEDADEKEEDEAEEKLFEDSDEKEDGDVVEKLFEEEDSDKLFEEDSCDKLFEPYERGAQGDLGNHQEEGPLSTGSSFVLSSDDDEEEEEI
ncbi:PREDICTED: HIV Tat-specific factor 1 homolog [Elephantulus edwardii]|uniref:HIV Tat-specific factor 1 homolog n=1 Tax=Elephantulus edwardii TaxID=28737 RepID=UPI0003F0979E|nr:PREDICTED: HIV Tat-specific factor 1 homolog [Elephantulus edwardii]